MGGILCASSSVFDLLHRQFFEADLENWDEDVRSLRERFHLEDIGGSAVVDKYAIVVATTTVNASRLVWKRWRDSKRNEITLSTGDVEAIGQQYIDWGQQSMGKR